MVYHACPQCGLETRCSRRSWADHPVAAATTGLSALTLASMLLTRSLIASLSTLVVGGAAVTLWAVDRARQRRATSTARVTPTGRAVSAAPPVLSLLAPRASARESKIPAASTLTGDSPT